MKKFSTLFILLMITVFGIKAQTIINFSSIDSARMPLTGTPQDSGSIVRVSGIVYGPNLFHYASGQTFWLNDGTAGIKIYSTHKYAGYQTVTDGDSITVVGRLSAFYSAAEIDLADTAAYDTIIFWHHNTPDTPIVIASTGFSTQTYGTLVQVNNVNMTNAVNWGKDTTSTGAHKTYFTCHVGSLYIYVDSFAVTSHFHDAQPQGLFNVVGIGDDYSPTSFNLDVRSWADFIPVTANSVSNIENAITAMIYPNPANTQLNVTMSSDKYETVTCKMIDVTGKVVLAENKEVTEGTNTLQFNTSALTNGIYILELRAGEKALNTKIVINK